MPTILSRFQQKKTAVPDDAVQLCRSSYPGKTHDMVLCPNCSISISMDHGDRILCDCGVILENYGNSLKMWEPNGSEFGFVSKAYHASSFYDLPVVARILHDAELKDAYDNIPGVKDLLEELNFLLKLHEGIDT